MSIYVKIGKKILKNPNIIRPHVKTKDISELNFKKMKDMGMEKIIFGKDNCITKAGRIDFIDEKTNADDLYGISKEELNESLEELKIYGAQIEAEIKRKKAILADKLKEKCDKVTSEKKIMEHDFTA